MGFTFSYGKYAEERDIFDSSSIESRIEDLHGAFKDPTVSGILPAFGGFNSNQLLKYIDYSLIRLNPKPLCGFSDITALANAIYAKTSVVTYSGPNFSSFGMLQGFEYSLEYFKKCLVSDSPFVIEPSKTWSDDSWFKDQMNRDFIPNEGYQIINEGVAEGTSIGGNLCTLNLLQGTEFMPSMKDSILFIEDDYECHPATIDRDLQSLIHLSDFSGVRGVVIGRFQKATNMTTEKIVAIVKSKRELASIPVVANASFGHTEPRFTFPIGGVVRLEASKERGMVSLQVVLH
jgi:muramoyltetrapeptide carboxypeptidase